MRGTYSQLQNRSYRKIQGMVVDETCPFKEGDGQGGGTAMVIRLVDEIHCRRKGI